VIDKDGYLSQLADSIPLVRTPLTMTTSEMTSQLTMDENASCKPPPNCQKLDRRSAS